MKRGILEGIRVLDLTRMLSGPYATMLLADHGAEVIKVESLEGDSSRRSGPFRADDIDKKWSGYFVSLNRNKKSISLNLKNQDDIVFLKKLVENSDVLVENFRPGVMSRLGLSFEELLKINTRLVYGTISGFGSEIFGESPYKDWPSYDVVAQAMGGLISLTGFDETTPVKVGPGIADIFSGSLLSFGLLASILKSRECGKGQFVEVAMYDAIVSMCERAIYQYDFDRVIPKPEGNGHPLLAPFGIYSAKDGFVAIGIVEDVYWNVLKHIINLNELLDDRKYGTISLRAKNRNKLNKLVNNWSVKFKKKELIEILGGKIPFGPVNNVKDIFQDDHISKRDMILEIKQPFETDKNWRVAGNPIKFKGFDLSNLAPPILGEHNQFYTKNLKTATLNNKQDFFQPEPNHYKCKVTFLDSKNDIYDFYASSFTWLKSKANYLICSINKNQFTYLKEDYLRSVKFFFSKVDAKINEQNDDLIFLNSSLSEKKISEVTIFYAIDDILLTVKR